MPDEDRINVEYDVESYEEQPDGSIILICTNGARLRLVPDNAKQGFFRFATPHG